MPRSTSVSNRDSIHWICGSLLQISRGKEQSNGCRAAEQRHVARGAPPHRREAVAAAGATFDDVDPATDLERRHDLALRRRRHLDQRRADHGRPAARSATRDPTPTASTSTSAARSSPRPRSRDRHRLANALRQLGVQPGDRVATLIENSAEAMLAWWGVVRAGAIAVPINTAYKGEYLRHQLADSDHGCSSSRLTRRPGRGGRRQVDSLDHVVVIDDHDHGLTGATTHRWVDLLGPTRRARRSTCDRRTWPPSSTPAGRPDRRRAACSATTTTRR